MMLHRELFDIAEAREVAFGMEVAKLLDRFGFKDVGGAAVELPHQFGQGLRELASRIGRRILRVRHEVIDVHDIVFVGIDEGQVARDGIRRTAALAVDYADDQEMTNTRQAVITKRQKEYRGGK